MAIKKGIGVPPKKTPSELISANRNLMNGIAAQLSDTHASEGLLHTVNIETLSLNQNNPREQVISKERMFELVEQKKHGTLSFDDETEKVFFEQIEALAHTITPPQGLIQPILVEDNSGKLSVVSGYRRVLAHIYNEKPTIRAIVRQSNTSQFQSDLTAFIENVSREDLTFKEFILSSKSIVDRINANSEKPLSSEKFANLIGITRQHGHRVMSIITGSSELLNQVITGEIASFRDYAKAKALMDEKKNVDEKPKSYVIRANLTPLALNKLFKLVGMEAIEIHDKKSLKSAIEKLIEQLEKVST